MQPSTTPAPALEADPSPQQPPTRAHRGDGGILTSSRLWGRQAGLFPAVVEMPSCSGLNGSSVPGSGAGSEGECPRCAGKGLLQGCQGLNIYSDLGYSHVQSRYQKENTGDLHVCQDVTPQRFKAGRSDLLTSNLLTGGTSVFPDGILQAPAAAAAGPGSAAEHGAQAAGFREALPAARGPPWNRMREDLFCFFPLCLNQPP